MNLNLENKIALVTAASSGLGYATAKALLAEGAKVAVCGRSLSRLQSAYGEYDKSQLLLIESDLRQKSSVTQLVEEVASQFGGLDMLMANIGGPPLISFEDASVEQWQAAHETIVMSVIHCVKASLPYLKKSECPSVLAVTSVTAKQHMANFLLSNVYRQAVTGLTKSLSKELGQFSIRVNSILPGFTMTARLKSTLEIKAKANGVTLAQESEALCKKVPLGRIGKPEEFANVATFLLSPASSYVSGAMVPVDGGWLDS